MEKAKKVSYQITLLNPNLGRGEYIEQELVKDSSYYTDGVHLTDSIRGFICVIKIEEDFDFNHSSNIKMHTYTTENNVENALRLCKERAKEKLLSIAEMHKTRYQEAIKLSSFIKIDENECSA